MNLWQGVAHLVTGSALGTGWREVLLNILMPLFFFYVGQEIRNTSHERLETLISPVLAALGGMLVPAAIYFALAGAWGLPFNTFGTALPTDLPLVLLALLLLPRAIRAKLRHYILVLAVADDLGSILILAFGFNTHFNIGWLLGQVGVLVLIFWLRDKSYVLLLVTLGWWVSLHTGVQPTVIAAMMGVIVASHSPRFHLHLERIAYFICIPLFLFALLSKGLSLHDLSISSMDRLSVATILARIIGKPTGIILGAWVARKLWKASGLSAREITIVGTFGIFGLSVSLLFLHIATKNSEVIAHTTTAIIYINVIAAAIAAGWRYFLTRATAA